MEQHKDLQRLQKEAIKSVAFRGHMLGPWGISSRRGACVSATLACCTNSNCKAYVQVNANPMPNEIDIGGDAVALNCPVTGEE